MNAAARTKRLSMNLTQIQMAAKAGVSFSTICSFEAGRLRPSPTTIRKLSGAYGMTIKPHIQK